MIFLTIIQTFEGEEKIHIIGVFIIFLSREKKNKNGSGSLHLIRADPDKGKISTCDQERLYSDTSEVSE